MFSSKSEHLLSDIFSSTEDPLIFSFISDAVNTRSHDTVAHAQQLSMEDDRDLIYILVRSHIARQMGANPRVFIDEVQFAPDAPMFLAILDILEGWGIPYTIAGLSRDYTGKPFPITKELATRDGVINLYATCEVCSGDATESQRLWDGRPVVEEGETVVLDTVHGGITTYTYAPRCMTCFVPPTTITI